MATFYRKLTTAVLLLGLLFFFIRQVHWEEVRQAFLNANFSLLLLGVSLTAFYPVLSALRWKSVLRAFNVRPSFEKILESVMIAFSANLFAPAKSGDFIKAYVLRKEVPVEKTVPGVIAERLGDVLILSCLAVVGGLLISNRNVILFGLLLSFGILMGIFASHKLSLKRFPGKVSKVLTLLQEGGTIWRKTPRFMLESTAWSFLVWVSAAVQMSLFFYALGAPINPGTVIALFPIAILSSLLPITPGGIGVRESLFAFLFLPYAKAHISVAVSLGYYLCSYWLTGLLGVGFIYLFLNSQDFRFYKIEKEISGVDS